MGRAGFAVLVGLVAAAAATAARVNGRNLSTCWETARTVAFVRTWLARARDVEGIADPDLSRWLDAFERDESEAALGFWFEIRKGVQESLREPF